MDTNRFKTKPVTRPVIPAQPHSRRVGLREVRPVHQALLRANPSLNPSPPLSSQFPGAQGFSAPGTPRQPQTPYEPFEHPLEHKQYDTNISPDLPPQPLLEGQGSGGTTISIRLSVPQVGSLKLPAKIQMTPKRWLVFFFVLWIIFTLGYQMGRHASHQLPAAYAPSLNRVIS